ncbi:MAG: hypothetical protein J4G13_14290 [Dehalococcoidia bacterium]|nr:hypothetical protein [Dehalococcoidia bacterium]
MSAHLSSTAGKIGLELLAGVTELFDLGQFVVEEAADEAMEVPGPGHIDAHGLLAVLESGGIRRPGDRGPAPDHIDRVRRIAAAYEVRGDVPEEK